MGEYALFNGERVKIGTCESMYYLRYDQRHLVVAQDGNIDPVKDVGEIRFRFPFPDEDQELPGGFYDYGYERALEIPGYEPLPEFQALLEKPAKAPIKIVQQRLVEEDGHQELQVVVQDSSGQHDYGCQLFRLNKAEALRAAEALLDADDGLFHEFYVLVASRMVNGYTLPAREVAAT